MDEKYDTLIDFLEESVKRNGYGYNLTIGHLLSILKKIRDNSMNEGPSEGDGPDW